MPSSNAIRNWRPWRRDRVAPAAAGGWSWLGAGVALATLLVVVTTVVSLGRAQETYFEATALDASRRQWFGGWLARLDEPVLGTRANANSYRALRVLYLPAWEQGIALRYEYDGAHALRRIVASSPRGDGSLQVDRREVIGADEFERIWTGYRRAGLWTLGTDDGVRGRDGSQLVIETTEAGQHRVFVRWTPEYDSAARGLVNLRQPYETAFEQAGIRLPESY
jgi:hypothetical protein